MSTIAYRPEIDGLRSVAIIPVLLFHLGLDWIPGGFAGVDVFFVISGYLITSIILKDFAAGTFSMKTFWLRRFRRIFPVLIVTTLATLGAFFWLGFRLELAPFGTHGLAALLSVANIVIWRTAGDYWGSSAEASPFLHCWSLSVEEQFYVLFPVLIVLCLKRSRHLAYAALLLAFSTSLLLFLWSAPRFPAATFYLLPFRAWELAVGCLFAFLVRDGRVQATGHRALILPWAGFLAILSFYFFLPGGRLSIFMILPVFGSALVIGFSSAQVGLGKLLAHPIPVFIGKVSYSLYLWHWPLITLMRQIDSWYVDSWQGRTLLLLAMSAMSILSYFLVENPFRRPTSNLRPLIAGFAAASTASIALAAYNPITAYDTSEFDPVAWHAPHYNVGIQDPATRKAIQKKMFGTVVRDRDPNLELAFANAGILKMYGGEKPDILVLGDSHATMWSGPIDDLAQEWKVSASFFGAAAEDAFVDFTGKPNPREGLNFSKDQLLQFNAARIKAIRDFRPVVILAARWSLYLNSTHRIEQFLDFCLQEGVQVKLIEQPPEIAIGNRNSSQYLAYRKIKAQTSPDNRCAYKMSNQSKVDKGRQLIRKLDLKYPNVEIIPTYDLFDAGSGMAWVLIGSQLLYYDNDHLSAQGAAIARERFRTALQEPLQHPNRKG
jgi:peptidoglycan/LPS O-acetylase OafA/YrhL